MTLTMLKSYATLIAATILSCNQAFIVAVSGVPGETGGISTKLSSADLLPDYAEKWHLMCRSYSLAKAIRLREPNTEQETYHSKEGMQIRGLGVRCW